MATSVTIHGGTPSDTISFAFTVTGTNTTAYANAFATNVNNILTTGSITAVAPSNGAHAIQLAQTAQTPVYVLTAPTSPTAPVPDYTIAAAGYVLDTISGAANITLAGGGADTVLVAAINAEALVTGAGADNQVIFVTGNNIFDGTADTGGDTVVAGSGFDTIYTSQAGSTTVNSGTGNATIYLQDTATGGVNDFVWLDDGKSTIYANGVNDAVVATTAGQTVYGDSAAGASTFLGVMFTANSDTTTANNGNDVVYAQFTDTVAVYDYSSNNTIQGGSGALFFVGGANITATIDIGSGNILGFGTAGDSITFGATAGETGGGAYFAAGTGNETLNGAAATGNLALFGGTTDTTSGGAGTPTDSLVGGSGYNILTAGAGDETLQGGTGTNLFQFSGSETGSGNVLINDFASNSGLGTLVLSGFADGNSIAQSIYNDTTTSASGGLVATIGSTSVTFSGITSGSQLQGHIIVFNS